MTWDTYNRRKTALLDILSVADARPGDVTVDELFDLIPKARQIFADDIDFLLDVQMTWFQRLSGQLDRMMSDPGEAPQSVAISAWMAAAAQMPGARSLLDANAHRPELAKALARERLYLAEAAGVPKERGQLIFETARDAVSYRPIKPASEQSSFMSRLRNALAA